MQSRLQRTPFGAHWLTVVAAILVSALLALPACAQGLQEGKEYVRLKNPVPVESGAQPSPVPGRVRCRPRPRP